MSYPAPTAPFIRARYHGGRQTPRAVVIHATVSPDTPGTARDIARWWNGRNSPVTSAHYVVDPREVIQCVGDHTVAYHCGYNTGSVAIELCDEQTGPPSRWKDANSRAIMRRAARLTAELCLADGIDTHRPTVAALKAKGPHGIYGHDDSRLAFGHTTHTDPRDFPWADFLGMVHAEVRKIKGAQTPTRVENFRAKFDDSRRADLRILDRATGRRDARRTARSIRAQVDRLRHVPGNRPGTRVGNFLARFDDRNVASLRMLDRAVKAGRRGVVEDVRNKIEAAAKSLRK